MEGFDEALTRAIDESGLSLERIQRRLGQKGLQVSLSTLSYWRRGRSRPERPESLKVVTVLEEILGLPEGDLTGRLGEKRPRGRWVGGQALTWEHIWDAKAGDLGTIMTSMEKSGPSPLTYLTLRDVQAIGPDGRLGELRCSAVVQAMDDGVDRFVAVQLADETDVGVGSIVPEGPCRLGRVRGVDRFLLAEIVFDRVLRKGETAIVDYRITQRPGEVSSTTDRRFTRSVRDYLLQVDFHPDAVPVRCFSYYRPSLQEPEVKVNDLWIGTTMSTHMVVRDMKPGIHGIRWEWE